MALDEMTKLISVIPHEKHRESLQTRHPARSTAKLPTHVIPHEAPPSGAEMRDLDNEATDIRRRSPFFWIPALRFAPAGMTRVRLFAPAGMTGARIVLRPG